MEKPVAKIKRISEKTTLIKMYEKGKLGKTPTAENRLRAGVRFAADWRASLFNPKITRNYDRLFVQGGKNGADAPDWRCDAADRYLRALKRLGSFGVYARHFLRDEGNIREFLLKYPVLNGTKATYAAVYRAINAMLDALDDFYRSEK